LTNVKHKVFICYHHANDQGYKNDLLRLNIAHDLFINGSVDTGDIDEDLDDETIRRKIRDEYLQDSTVTIVLVGTETKYRKHVDWEIYSSMYDGTVNKKSGILVINLPTTGCTQFNAGHGDREKQVIYPETTTWVSCSRTEYESRYPYLPDRILDNLVRPGAKVSVTNWNTLDIDKLRFLIEVTFNDRATCDYDLSQPMRRANSPRTSS
jgi:MTH538 TIR-like domain (DUF1863)